MAAEEELAIFRGYKSAYALDVLYHQAELLHLLQDWAEEVREDQHADDNTRRSFEYYLYKLSRPEVSQKHSAQWLKWMEVREKLKEYRQAIATFRDVSNEPQANSHLVDTLRFWLTSGNADIDFPRGSEADIWQEGMEYDLISVMNPNKRDSLSTRLVRPIFLWIHDNVTKRFMKEVELKNPFLAEEPVPTPLRSFSNSTIEGGAGAVSTVLASMFPPVSIFALYYAPTQLVRMGLIMAFSFVFSVVLVLVAKARRVDCFAATAAFAALQVVFVGQQQGTGCTC